MRIWPVLMIPLCLVLTEVAEARAKGPTRVQVQGHRGARALRPENTLAAFEYALKVGVDVIELDLLMSRDDQLVVVHDPYVNPVLCRGPKGAKVPAGLAVRSLTLAELRSYDCGSVQNPRFPEQVPVPGAQIPAFEQVLDLLQHSPLPAAKTVHLNIETKLEPSHPELFPDPAAFAEQVVKALKRRKLISRAVVQSFDARTLVHAKRLAPKLRISMLISDNAPPLVPIARDLGAQIVSPHHEWITKETVQGLHKAGVAVVPWTANDPEAWARLVDFGVDGIITDDPARLIAWLKQRDLR